MIFRLFLCALLFSSQGIIEAASPNKCEFYASDNLPPEKFEVNAGLHDSGVLTDDGKAMDCYAEFSECMVLWSFDAQTNETEVRWKGCWKGNGDCSRGSCIATEEISLAHLNNSRFCCCSDFMCNQNFSYVYVPKSTVVPRYPPQMPAFVKDTDRRTVILIVSSVFAVLAVLIVFAMHRYWKWKKISNLKLSSGENGGELTTLLGVPETSLLHFSVAGGDFDINRLVLLNLVGSGRYGNVWRAVDPLNEKQEFAVKIFDSSKRSNFLNECLVYKLPFMEHGSLLSFYGAMEKLVSDQENILETPITATTPMTQCVQNFIAADGSATLRREYRLVTNYAALGTLQEFLKTHTLTWEQMCTMGHSLASGLAHLHAEIKGLSGPYKPAIVHRDLSSKNVLMKDEKHCVICDLGFALPLDFPTHPRRDGGDDQEISLAEVGTLRYLAPEALEGAVNLRDAHNALKQVDMYALGLVLHEMVSRCGEIYHLMGQEVQEYQPPYSKEIAAHPTLEQLQIYVCRKKVRPTFPMAMYKIPSPALRTLQSIIEDCWDADSEARLSSLCVQERFAELVATKSGCLTSYNGRSISPNAAELQLNQRNLQHRGGGLPNQQWVAGGDSSATSGIGSLGSHSGGSNSYAALEPPPVQPYQGLNPCLERNMHQESSEESGIERIAESPFLKVDPNALVANTVLRMQVPTTASKTQHGPSNINQSHAVDGGDLSHSYAHVPSCRSQSTVNISEHSVTCGSSASHGRSFARSARDHVLSWFGGAKKTPHQLQQPTALPFSNTTKSHSIVGQKHNDCNASDNRRIKNWSTEGHMRVANTTEGSMFLQHRNSALRPPSAGETILRDEQMLRNDIIARRTVPANAVLSTFIDHRQVES